MSMTSGNGGSVLVIDADRSSAETLREMIEFLDTPHVAVADQQSWQSAVDDSLEVVFLGRGLDRAEVAAIELALRSERPLLPIVTVSERYGSQH